MNWYLLGVEMNLGHAHKTKILVPFKGGLEIFRRAPRHFYRGVPSPGELQFLVVCGHH